MKIVWSPRAALDLEELTDYIAADNSEAAQRVANRIYTQVVELGTTPFTGRIGAVLGTRELIFHPWPYIAVYRVAEDELRIVRIRHAAQEWP